MTYAGKTRQRINVPPHSQISKQLFMKKLAKARFLSGVTATGSALKAVASLKFPHSTDIIVVTDGFSFDSVDEEAAQLRFTIFHRSLCIVLYDRTVEYGNSLGAGVQ
ncbi:hypothetical protein ANCCAN_08919 [Ancylostoma caninum]|uniref:VWFA domain-containing protein n=1 Tax=Ancylostoma caninum TaxID=29170 RepID=A0A368GL26_ANCCA|nr:hypothetical protein ANCCAN_08919 [Ancylostoma caninum]